MSNLRFSNAPALSETSTLNSTAALRVKCDGYYISNTNLLNKHGSVLIVSANQGTEVRSMMEFDVTSLPVGAKIIRAMLQVYVTECSLALPEEAMRLCCYGYIGDGNILPDDADTGSIVGVSTLANTRLTGLMRLSVAPGCVQRARETGYVGFRLETEASPLTTHPNTLLLRSGENIHPDSAPMLFIDYTLENASGAYCVVTTHNDMAP